MPRTIIIERFLEQRDVDAALYLLSRMLGLSELDQSRRGELLELKKRLEKSRSITEDQRHEVVASYREVIG